MEVKILEIYTVEQAAEKLSVSPVTIREWLRNGTLVGHKAGRFWRITDADIEEMFARNPQKVC